MINSTISPLRTPVPRHPDQVVMFESEVDTTFAVPGAEKNQSMAVTITIRLHRAPRQKCSSCGNRRVCFYVGLSDVIQSPPMCARCSGIR